MASSTRRKLRSSSSDRKRTRVEKEEEEEVEGFKFSRRSRRAKVSGGRSQKKPSGSAAKRRRSSFVRGRKERKSLQPLKTTEKPEPDIFRDIPDDLPPQAKLRKVFDASLQLAIEKIYEEEDMPTIPNFKEEARDIFQQLRDIISDSDIVDKACTVGENEVQGSSTNPNNADSTKIEQDASNCQKIIERLECEEDKWERLRSKYLEQYDQTMKDCSEANNNIEEMPDFLSPEQHQLLSERPNIRGIMDKMVLMQQKAMLEVDEIAKVVQNLKKFTDVSGDFVGKRVASLGAKSMKSAKDVGTPRTLIRGALGKK